MLLTEAVVGGTDPATLMRNTTVLRVTVLVCGVNPDARSGRMPRTKLLGTKIEVFPSPATKDLRRLLMGAGVKVIVSPE